MSVNNTNNNNFIDYKVGDRFETKEGEHGFIRYVGPLENQPDSSSTVAAATTWYGVEWDEEGRGKHDGVAYGKRYFQTRHPQGASFIKGDKLRSKKHLFTFPEALIAKYDPESMTPETKEKLDVDKEVSEGDEFRGMYVYTIRDKKVPIEMVGEDKIQQVLSKTHDLQQVGLRFKRIYSEGMPGEIQRIAPNIQELDLTGNLIHSWDTIINIAHQLPSLEVLVLTANRFDPNTIHPSSSPSSSSSESAFNNVRVLVLNETHFTWHQIEAIKSDFPQLEELHLCDNHMSSFELGESQFYVSGYDNLKLLNLENNRFSDWNAEIARLSQLPNLERLILNDNLLESIEYPSSTSTAFVPFANLKSISLNNNRISSWRSIDELNRFPQLEELRINAGGSKGGSNTNTALASVSPNVGRALLIARLGRLVTLNGSVVRPKERDDAEKYYLKQCAAELQQQYACNPADPEFKTAHPRYAELVQKHGDPMEALAGAQSAAEAQGSFAKDLVSVTLRSMSASTSGGAMEATRKLPTSTMTVQKLKQMCQRLFKLDPSLQRLYYRESRDNPIPDALDDDFKLLSYYGIKDGGEIIMEEIDPEKERAERERQEKERDEAIQKQMRDIEHKMKMQRMEYQ